MNYNKVYLPAHEISPIVTPTLQTGRKPVLNNKTKNSNHEYYEY